MGSPVACTSAAVTGEDFCSFPLQELSMSAEASARVSEAVLTRLFFVINQSMRIVFVYLVMVYP